MVKVFYDGTDMLRFAHHPLVVGFTTNTTIMRQSNQLCYQRFYETYVDQIKGRPISFQVFSDDSSTVREQARMIRSISNHPIYVKVPVSNSTGETFLPVILELLEEEIPINVTAVFTKEQIDLIYESLSLHKKATSAIVSIFGGRISDTGVEPKEIIRYAVERFVTLPWVEILWAGVKDNLILQQCQEVGCHIATLPDAIMSRIDRIGQPLDDLSKDTVRSFLKDAVDGKLTITK